MLFPKQVLKFVMMALSLTLMAISGVVSAETDINDAAALHGLKNAKGVFLIDFDNIKKTAFYLEIIEGTHASFTKQNVKPEMVLVFIGPTVQYLTTKPGDELEMEFSNELGAIKASVKRLDELGVRMEVCAVATKVFGVDNKTILPGMDVVGDGFISLIGWQTQGYKLVPIF